MLTYVNTDHDRVIKPCYAMKYKGHHQDEILILKTLILNTSHNNLMDVRIEDDEALILIDNNGRQSVMTVGSIFVIEIPTGKFFITDDIGFEVIFGESYSTMEQ
ncbi:MAG: hypothetical protein K6G00_02035 [Treponema sp.]|nr:hypothetical protein [Treponema sp.]